ncbi:MAG: tetratricopeptide repeat protein [Cytophagales bacterium]|nr:tetratricopeptide repeat protein [Cytophagales bacterium]
MKKRFIPLCVLAGAMTFSGCSLNKMAKLAKEQQLTVTPNPLEVHADQVDFEMSAVLPQKMMKKNLNYVIDPAYKYGNKKEKLQSVTVKGNDYPDASVQPKVSEKFSFPYKQNMGNGDLVITGRAVDSRSGNEKVAMEDFAIAKGLITTSTLVEKVASPVFANHGYNDQEELIPTYAEFFFPQGSPYLNVRSSANRNQSKALKAFVAEKNVTRTVIITGTHSPEGSERVNSNLSEKRAAAVEREYRKLMKRYDYKGTADKIDFILKPVVDNWTQFKTALADFDKLSQAQKNEALRIVNGAGTFEEKQNKLEKLPFYRTMFRGMYPSLRNAKTEVLTVKEKKTNAEIAVLAKQIANGTMKVDTLSKNEMLWAAHMTPSIKEKKRYYEILVKKSNDWTAHNNLSAVYMAEAEAGKHVNKLAEKAITEAELANKLHENPESYANMAGAYLLQGNVAKAYEMISKASSMNPDRYSAGNINATKGAIEVRLAKYEEAIATLSSATRTADNLFNKGLSQLLNKEYQNAAATLKEAAELDKNFAKAYYVEAIALTRAGKTADAVRVLAKATQLNASLKEKAINDLEFANIASEESFKNAVK